MSNVLLVTGISPDGRPFAAYGKSSERPEESSRLQLETRRLGLLKSGVSCEGRYNTMLARYDRALFAGNGPHIGFEDVDGKGPGMFRDYGKSYEEHILPLWVRQFPQHYLRKPPISLVVLIDENDGRITPKTTFSAGIVRPGVRKSAAYSKPQHVLPAHDNIFVLTADDWRDSEHCRGFSTRDLAIANNNGFAPYIPLRDYPISGRNPDEIASNVYEFMGKDAVAACAAVFENDTIWHMAVKNRQ